MDEGNDPSSGASEGSERRRGDHGGGRGDQRRSHSRDHRGGGRDRRDDRRGGRDRGGGDRDRGRGGDRGGGREYHGPREGHERRPRGAPLDIGAEGILWLPGQEFEAGGLNPG